MAQQNERRTGGSHAARTLGSLSCLAALLALLPAGAEERQPSHDVELEFGVGYDSNPFLTPDGAYFDQNQERVVSPTGESGLFWPIRIDGKLAFPSGPGARAFVTEYRLKSGLYADSATSNADELYARIEPGFRFDLGVNTRRDRVVELRAIAAYDKEVYFDRDTGLSATSSGIDLANRFTYTSLGAETVLDYEASKAVTFSAELRAEARNYRDVTPIESFDQDRLRASAGVEFRLSRSSRLYFDYGYELQQYDERHARSADGNDTLENPLLEYAITTLASTLRFKPASPWTVEIGLSRRKRGDRHIGYNEYIQDRLRVRGTVNGRRGWARLTASYSERDFERAFIFDQPFDPRSLTRNPVKAYEMLDVELHAYLPWKKHLRPFTRMRYVDQRTEDPRFAYERNLIMTGLELLF